MNNILKKIYQLEIVFVKKSTEKYELEACGYSERQTTKNDTMGENSKFPKSCTFDTPVLKLAVCPLNIHNLKLKWSNDLRQTENKSEKL